MSDFDSKFMQDDELRSLLRQWSAPNAPGSLDQRVAAAYQQAMSSSALLSNSALSPQGNSEVVTMKFCDTCQEEFADRFSFCPVDGTPLSAAPVASVNTPPAEIEATYPVAETSTFQRSAAVPLEAPAPIPAAPVPTTPAPASANTGLLGEYHLTILEDRGLASRLAGELGGVAHNYQLTWPEFKRDPFGFVKRSVQGYGQMVGRFFARRDAVIAVGISLVALAALVGLLALLDRTSSAVGSRVALTIFALGAFTALIVIFAGWMGNNSGAAVMGAKPSDSRNVLSGIVVAFVLVFGVVGFYVFWSFFHQKALAKAQADEDQIELTQMISDIPNEQPTPDEGTAGMAKGNGGGSKPKQEKAGGGGGGGREEQTPASFGKLPQADLRIPQVVAPDPHPPVIKNPALPMPATLDADPALFPPDQRQLQYGDPKSKSMTPSSGGTPHKSLRSRFSRSAVPRAPATRTRMLRSPARADVMTTVPTPVIRSINEGTTWMDAMSWRAISATGIPRRSCTTRKSETPRRWLRHRTRSHGRGKEEDIGLRAHSNAKSGPEAAAAVRFHS